MHKKLPGGKKTGTRIKLRSSRRPVPDPSEPGVATGGARFRQLPHSVKELLTHGAAFRQLGRAIPAQHAWLQWLRERLPGELAAHVVNVVPRGGAGESGGELVVFADSGAWSTRLRYALSGVTVPLRGGDAPLARISVRVQIGPVLNAAAAPGAPSGR